MNKKLKKKVVATGLSFVVVLVFVFLTDPVLAQKAQFLESLNQAAGPQGANIQGTDSVNLPQMIGSVLRGLFALLGTVFFALMFYGGFLWMTASGNEEQVGKAKKVITQAVVGLFIVVIANAISNFAFSTIVSSIN